MSQIYKCDHCQKEIKSELPKDQDTLWPKTTIRPYRIDFDKAPPRPEEICSYFIYYSATFHVCNDCKPLLLEFLGVK